MADHHIRSPTAPSSFYNHSSFQSSFSKLKGRNMKHLIAFTLLLSVLAIGFSNSFAQDSPGKFSDELKLKSVYIPEKTISRVPLRLENNILFLTNCPPRDNGICDLKYPLDATFVVPLFDGVGCNGPANPLDPLQRNDDDVTLAIPLGFNFNLYGTIYTTLFINNNGNVSFGNDFCTFTPFAFPSATAVLVAPFFADVDTRNTASGVVWMKSEANRFTVTWDSVGYFGNHADKLNTFQLIISDGTDPLVGIGNNVCFSYGDMQWTTGDASGGIGGFGGSPATVGVNKGDGVTYATLGRFDRPGNGYCGPGCDSNGVSYLDCQSFCFNASNQGNICPVAQGFPSDTVSIIAGNPYNAQYSFSAPEVSQIVSGGVSGVPPGMNVNINNGISCTFDVSWNPSCTQAGYYTVCFTGIDNFTLPCTTTVCVVYEVDCPLPVEMSSFISNVTGRDVELKWTTAMEANNSGFEVQRLVANETWRSIGFVTGSGNSTVPVNYSFTERGLTTGVYKYRLKQVDFNGEFQYHNLLEDVVIGVPARFELMQNYPNPFNPTTKIDYAIPSDGLVRLEVYDAMGRLVKTLVNANKTAGYYTIEFDASQFASGVYYYKLNIIGQDNNSDTKRMLLVK